MKLIWDLKHISSSQIVSCSLDKKIKLWNLETNECLRTFNGHTQAVRSLEISFDKSNLYSGSSDKTLRVWVISSGECLKTIDFDFPILCLKLLSSDILAVGLSKTKENLKIIDLDSHEMVKSIETDQDAGILSLNFNYDDKVLFTGSNCGKIKVFQF